MGRSDGSWADGLDLKIDAQFASSEALGPEWGQMTFRCRRTFESVELSSMGLICYRPQILQQSCISDYFTCTAAKLP